MTMNIKRKSNKWCLFGFLICRMSAQRAANAMIRVWNPGLKGEHQLMQINFCCGLLKSKQTSTILFVLCGLIVAFCLFLLSLPVSKAPYLYDMQHWKLLQLTGLFSDKQINWCFLCRYKFDKVLIHLLSPSVFLLGSHTVLKCRGGK